jgi:hypothetical protein
MTIEYAMKITTGGTHFKAETDYLAVHTDPGHPYRKLQGFAKSHHEVALVKREDGSEWEPVNGIDQVCIGMRAKHEIMKKRSLVEGFGWARCTCGWQDENNYKFGYAVPDYEESAARHIAEVDARIRQFRELLRYVQHTPEQEACPHLDDETRDDYTNPTRKEWRCHSCGFHVAYDLEIAS